VQINDDMYEDLTGPKMVEVLGALKAGTVPPHGSQTGRQTSAPTGGPQVLNDLDFAKAD
jgi:NADH-quinone oxidoreductase subunit E